MKNRKSIKIEAVEPLVIAISDRIRDGRITDPVLVSTLDEVRRAMGWGPVYKLL